MIKHQLASPSAPKRVVILGGSGFLGTALKKTLEARGAETLSLSSKDIDLDSAEATAKLLNTLRADDAVVMASALTPDKGKDMATLMKNLRMAQSVAAYLEQRACAHFVYVSSDAVYEMSDQPVSENTPAHPTDLYAAMHLTREVLFKSAVGNHKTPLLIVRPTGLYGTGDTHNSYGPNRFLKTAKQDRKIALFGGGEEMRDHVHVEDAARLMAECLFHRSTGCLNIATGRSLSFMDVATEVSGQLGGVKIETSPRANPITYRHFDLTNTIKAFPTFRYKTLKEGLSQS